MPRDRKHSRLRRIWLLATIFAPNAGAQLLRFNETALPVCAYSCASIYQAQFACNASFAQNGGSKGQWRCFCQSDFVLNIASGKGKSECDDVCSGEGRKQTNSWILNKCDEALDRKVETTTTASPTPTPTPTAEPTPKLPIPERKEEVPEKKPWLAKAWPFLVLALLLLLLPILGFALYRYFRPYFKRRAIAIEPTGISAFSPTAGAAGAAGLGRQHSSLYKKSHRRVDSSGRQYTTIPIADAPPVIPPLGVLARERRRKDQDGLLDAHEQDFSDDTLTDNDLELGLAPPKKPITYESVRSVSDSTAGSGTTRVPPSLNARSVSDATTASGTTRVHSPTSNNFSGSSPRIASPAEVDLGDVRGAGGMVPIPLGDPTPLSVVTALDKTPSPGVDRQWSWEDGEEDEYERRLGLNDIHPAYRDDDFDAYPAGMRTEGGLRVVNAEVDGDDWREGSTTASESPQEGPVQYVEEEEEEETQEYYDSSVYDSMLTQQPPMPPYSPVSPLRTPLHTLMEVDEEGLSRESSRRSRRAW